LVPVLTLGIPGDSTTALLFGAFMAHGLRPGPALMQEQGPVVYGILLAMVMANILFLVLGYLTLPLFSRVVRVKRALLLPMVCIIAFAGSYVFRSDPMDLLVVVFFGIFSYIARKLHFDISLMVIGFILGPILEFSVGQTLTMADENLPYWFFVNRPIAGVIFVAIPLIGLLASVRAIRRRRKANNFDLPTKGGGD
jgi:putative tricarboxylic transport membrane protein